MLDAHSQLVLDHHIGSCWMHGSTGGAILGGLWTCDTRLSGSTRSEVNRDRNGDLMLERIHESRDIRGGAR